MAYVVFILFLLCLLVPVFSYVIFPWLMKVRASKITYSKQNYTNIKDWPAVTIVFSVFNEEKVIGRKLESIVNSDYPKDKLLVLIGSDNSTDSTNAVIEEYITKYSFIKLIKKTNRNGKLKIINELIDLTTTEHLVFTDANVFFEPLTIRALIYDLVEKQAQLVCGNIHKFSPKNEGISDQEIFYMNFENRLKHNESLVYDFCVGVEGGCYAIKKQSFVKVPDGFLMDDFFITLDVISKQGKVVFEPEALCYEDVNDAPMIEFKRKIRISLGNFRNLRYYKHLLFPVTKGFGFAFFSHKVLRWVTPFAMIVSFICSLILTMYVPFFKWISLAYGMLIVLPLLTVILEKIKLKIPLVNALGHFILMNFALLLGYFKFISASHESAWEPPKRNV
ncbi:MAG: glycosyltransferase [Bacteroidetes bacterium]|nr:glycosyltransferase [Bacteroidota bacterium]